MNIGSFTVTPADCARLLGVRISAYLMEKHHTPYHGNSNSNSKIYYRNATNVREKRTQNTSKLQVKQTPVYK